MCLMENLATQELTICHRIAKPNPDLQDLQQGVAADTKADHAVVLEAGLEAATWAVVVVVVAEVARSMSPTFVSCPYLLLSTSVEQ